MFPITRVGQSYMANQVYKSADRICAEAGCGPYEHR